MAAPGLLRSKVVDVVVYSHHTVREFTQTINLGGKSKEEKYLKKISSYRISLHGMRLVRRRADGHASIPLHTQFFLRNTWTAEKGSKEKGGGVIT